MAFPQGKIPRRDKGIPSLPRQMGKEIKSEKMIDKKYYTIVIAFLMAFAMALVMSFAITLLKTGFDAGFIERWLGGFVIGFIVGFPISIVIFPAMKKVADRLTSNSS